MAHASGFTRQEASKAKRAFEKEELNQLCDQNTTGMKKGTSQAVQGTGDDVTGARRKEPPHPPKLPQGRTNLNLFQNVHEGIKSKKEMKNRDDNLAGVNPQEAMKTMAGAQSLLEIKKQGEIKEGIAYLEMLRADLDRREKEFMKSQLSYMEPKRSKNNFTLVTDDFMSETEDECSQKFTSKISTQTSGKPLKTPPITAPAVGRGRAKVSTDSHMKPWTNEEHFRFPFVNNDQYRNQNIYSHEQISIFPNKNQNVNSRKNQENFSQLENNLVGQNIRKNVSAKKLLPHDLNRIDTVEIMADTTEGASDTQLSDTTFDTNCPEEHQLDNETFKDSSEIGCDINKIDLDRKTPTTIKSRTDLNTSSEDDYDSMIKEINRPTQMQVEIRKNNRIENDYTDNFNYGQNIIGHKKGLPTKQALESRNIVVKEPPPLNVKIPQPKPRIQNPVGQAEVEDETPVDVNLNKVPKHTVPKKEVVQTSQRPPNQERPNRIRPGGNIKAPARNIHQVPAEVHEQHYLDIDPENVMLSDYLEQKAILEGFRPLRPPRQEWPSEYNPPPNIVVEEPPNIVVEEKPTKQTAPPNIVVEERQRQYIQPPNIVVEERPTSTPILECGNPIDHYDQQALEVDEFLTPEALEMYYNIRQFNPIVAEQMLKAGALGRMYITPEIPFEVAESEIASHHGYEKQAIQRGKPTFGSISPIPKIKNMEIENQKRKENLNGTFHASEKTEQEYDDLKGIKITDPELDENIEDNVALEKADDESHKSAFRRVQNSVGQVGSVDLIGPVDSVATAKNKVQQDLTKIKNDLVNQFDDNVVDQHHQKQHQHIYLQDENAKGQDAIKEFQRSPPSHLREPVLTAQQNFGPRHRVPTKPEIDSSSDSDRQNNTIVKGIHGAAAFQHKPEAVTMSVMQRMLHNVLLEIKSLTRRIDDMERKGEKVDKNNLDWIRASIAKERDEAIIKSMDNMKLNVAAVENTEQVETNTFCKLDEAEVERMRSQCDHTTIDKFTAAENQYWGILSELTNIQLTLAFAKQCKTTGPGAMSIRHLKAEQIQFIRHLKRLETKLEDDMKRISNERAGVYPTYTLPERFGDVDILISHDIGRVVPQFNPKKEGSKVKLTLNMLNSLVRTENISKDCYKNLLLQACKGEAQDFIVDFSDQPLEDIVTLLIHRYEPQRTTQDNEEDLENFTRKKGETLLMAITKLKALIYKLHHDKTPNELAALTLPILKTKLKPFVDPQVWDNACIAERKHSGVGKQFSFEIELQNQEKSTGRTWVPSATQQKAMHAMVAERPGRNTSRQGSPFSRNSSRSPGSPGRVWSGGGRVQKRTNNPGPYRNAPPPPPQQKPPPNPPPPNNPPPPPPQNKQYQDRGRPMNRDPPQQAQYQQQQRANQQQQQQVPLPGNQGFVQNQQYRQPGQQLPPPQPFRYQRSQSQGFNQRRQPNGNFRGRNQSIEPGFRNQYPQRYNQGPGQGFNQGNRNNRVVYMPTPGYRTNEQTEILNDYRNRSADQNRQYNVQSDYPNQGYNQGPYGNSYRGGYGRGRNNNRKKGSTRTIDQSFLMNNNETVRQRIEVNLGDICTLWDCRKNQNWTPHYKKDCPYQKENSNF